MYFTSFNNREQISPTRAGFRNIYYISSKGINIYKSSGIMSASDRGSVRLHQDVVEGEVPTYGDETCEAPGIPATGAAGVEGPHAA